MALESGAGGVQWSRGQGQAMFEVSPQAAVHSSSLWPPPLSPGGINGKLKVKLPYSVVHALLVQNSVVIQMGLPQPG